MKLIETLTNEADGLAARIYERIDEHHRYLVDFRDTDADESVSIRLYVDKAMAFKRATEFVESDIL